MQMFPKVLAVSRNYSNFKMRCQDIKSKSWLSTNLIKSSSVVLKHIKRSVSLNFKIITMAATPLVVFLTNHIFVMIVTVVMSTKTKASTLAKENGVGRVSGMTV